MSSPDVLRMVPAALALGFRHVDTAQIYQNEAAVGEAIAGSRVARSDIFLTTKVWIDNFRHGAFQASIGDSPAKLQTDHVDLLPLHWPNGSVPLAEHCRMLAALTDRVVASASLQLRQATSSARSAVSATSRASVPTSSSTAASAVEIDARRRSSANSSYSMAIECVSVRPR